MEVVIFPEVNPALLFKSYWYSDIPTKFQRKTFFFSINFNLQQLNKILWVIYTIIHGLIDIKHVSICNTLPKTYVTKMDLG